MKGSDLAAALFGILIAFFFIYEPTRDLYLQAYNKLPALISFLKFAVLATSGEMLVLRIKKGTYLEKDFGLLPKMIIWGFLGVFIYMAFGIFSHGVPALFPMVENRFFTAFLISLLMNVIFAPLMMLTHHLTDLHISKGSGIFKLSTFSPLSLLKEADWEKMWSFVFAKTIPFFWIPAHTVTFLLPTQYRTLFAALLSIALGLLLALSGRKQKT
ncbi:hypothetical protein [Spirochaeta isovalerica]|uniref:Mpv17/PMP22 n=1 Tax=Spirochaeta isovalerica TaxID=150 RepID=A0A841R3Z6_9SPIO|nr:hypothetical protein [Spirochaeta isovalerica]MBB6478523.1 hypothetical protein [Spirochaeta isovalerica]